MQSASILMTNTRPKTKTAVISHKVKPTIKRALVISSEAENRSQANMLEIMILEYCKNHNINYPKELNKKEDK